MLLTPPRSWGIVAVSLAELPKSHEDCAAGLSQRCGMLILGVTVN